MPLSSITTKSMIDLGNYAIDKKEVNEINNKITCNSAEFVLKYHFIKHLLDDAFQIHDGDKLQHYAGYKLLNHRAIKSNKNNNDYDLVLFKAKWNKAAQLKLKRPKTLVMQLVI